MQVEEFEVTIEGTSPLVLLPLGFFKDCPDDEDGQLERALDLYRREDGNPGFPAGGLKDAILEGCKKLDADTRYRVASGFHIVGENATNRVLLNGDSEGVDFDFNFKRPKRTVTRTLPQLDKWTCVFPVQLVTGSLDSKEFNEFLGVAGEKIGIGHRRPEMGTFKVTNIVSKNGINNRSKRKSNNNKR
jgi:hypothetical protein